MPPRVGSNKPAQTKTMAKASSSSKSSGSSKTSSSSGVKKATPPPVKPKNVDKVDFGKPKPQADAGVYHKPRLIAAATGRDPEPPKPKKTEPPKPVPPKSKNVDKRTEKVDFGKVKPPKVTYDAPRMQNVLATNKVAIAEVSRTKTQVHGKIMGTQRVETAPTTNEIDLPMKAKKDLKPDGAHHFLEHKNEMMDKVQAPEIARKIEAMSDLSAVIPAANHEYENLAKPIQNFCDICDAVEDFASNGTIEHLIENAFGDRSVADSYNALKTANNTLKATPEANFSQVGAAVAKAAAVSKVVGLLDNIAQKIPEANKLRIDLEAAYNVLARATDKFNLRNSEIFELAEQAGAKNIDMKYIVYPTTLAKVRSVFGI